MKINAILRKAQPTTTAHDIHAAFAHANTSKTHNRHHLANALFAFLLECHRDGDTDLRIGLEYLPLQEDEYGGYGEGDPLGNPANWINTDNIQTEQYHLLVFLYIGNRDKPTHYLCVPAPMLSTKALKYCFAQAKRQGGSMPRREHNREYQQGEPAVNIQNIGKVMPSFKFPTWVFEAFRNDIISSQLQAAAEPQETTILRSNARGTQKRPR